MARSAATQVEQNFTKGLITEATGLNYPENSCIETWDCEFDFFGRVSRRLGMDVESGSVPKTITRTNSAITKYHWKNVTGDGLISFIVAQVGNTLYFYQTSSTGSLSGAVLASTINLSTYTPGGAPEARLAKCQFADGLSKLYVFHPNLENFYVTYNSGAGTMSATQYTLKVRDFEGAVADPYAVDTRPVTTLGGMDANHKYNLFNQGWCKADLTTPELTAWDTARSDMPSNADVWWDFKNASDAFDTTTIANSGRGNTPAPNGHFILTAYNMDRATASGIGGISATTSGLARSSTGAFHAGRVFYAGINASGYTSKIYFTQIIEKDAQVGYCYQVSDPTSEDLFDLLPADGGVISIPEAGTIYKLFSIANGLLVFGYRGVWFISGSSGIGFTAIDYTVSKISSIRTVSASSFVDVNGVPMWWNTDGIFTVQGAQGGPQVQSMSISTMQSFYNEIPNNSKPYAVGEFNPLAQTVQWLFSTVAPQSTEDQHSFDAILNFNVLTGAFFPHTLSTGGANAIRVHAVCVVDAIGGIDVEETVVDNSPTTVLDDLGNTVIANLLTNTSITPKSKFLVSYGASLFTWAEFKSETYTDWTTLTQSTDYTSYFVTGYKIHGNATTKFAPMYVTVYNEGTGAAYIQGIWDYAHESSTGRYSTKQLMYFSDPDYTNLSKRVKIRGQGKTLQYLVKSVPGYGFNIAGWSAFETGNTAP